MREALEQFCNLGYAGNCGRLPREREWDAVRFAVSVDRRTELQGDQSDSVAPNRTIRVEYVCEQAHRPKDHGTLEFEGQGMECLQRHWDSRVQKMAECFLETYLVKRKSRAAENSSS